jgi:excisionase family DNA binding protein
MSRAYTVASLAEEWECSEGVIRKAIAEGRLGHFRIGNLIRIPADEVRRFECQTIPSNDSAAASQSCGETKRESATGNLLPRPIASARRQRPGSGGGSATVLHGPWDA